MDEIRNLSVNDHSPLLPRQRLFLHAQKPRCGENGESVNLAYQFVIIDFCIVDDRFC